jgi:DNA polymerase-3 subunit alpha (Gram-positive type)
MEADIRYYQRKFFQYGFATLMCEIIYEAIDFETVENEQTQKYRALMQEAQTKQQQVVQQRNSASRRMNNNRGNGKYNNGLDEPTYKKLIDVEDNAQNIVIHAMVMSKEIKISKTGRKIYLLNITDNTSSFKATYFSRNEGSTIFDDLTEEELNSDIADELKAQKAQIGD